MNPWFDYHSDFGLNYTLHVCEDLVSIINNCSFALLPGPSLLGQQCWCSPYIFTSLNCLNLSTWVQTSLPSDWSATCNTQLLFSLPLYWKARIDCAKVGLLFLALPKDVILAHQHLPFRLYNHFYIAVKCIIKGL